MMGTRYKLITFDLDDTLWEMKPVLVRAEQRVRAWADAHCPELYTRFSRDELMQRRIALIEGQPDMRHQISRIRVEVTRDALESCGYKAAEANRLALEAFEVFIAARHEVALFDEAEDCLRSLSERYTLGVLTNGNADIYRIGLGDYFAFAFMAEQLNTSKPSADMFSAALNAAGVSAAEMIHVGDHVDHDIVGAQSIGAATIWINPDRSSWPYATPPDEQVTHIGEVPEAVAKLERRGIQQ